MRCYIDICIDGVCYSYPLLNLDYQRIERPGVLIFDIWKKHNHRYELLAFFYQKKIIVGCSVFSTKAELYDAIQKLLQQFL